MSLFLAFFCCCQELLEMRGILFITNSFFFFFFFFLLLIPCWLWIREIWLSLLCCHNCRRKVHKCLWLQDAQDPDPADQHQGPSQHKDSCGQRTQAARQSRPGFDTRLPHPWFIGLGILFLIFLNKIFGQSFCVLVSTQEDALNFRSELSLWVINCSARLLVAVQWNCSPELCFVESYCCFTESSQKWSTLLFHWQFPEVIHLAVSLTVPESDLPCCFIGSSQKWFTLLLYWHFPEVICLAVFTLLFLWQFPEMIHLAASLTFPRSDPPCCFIDSSWKSFTLLFHSQFPEMIHLAVSLTVSISDSPCCFIGSSQKWFILLFH